MSDSDERKAKKRKLEEDINNLIKDYESENRSLKREVRRSKQLQDETDQLKAKVAQLQEKLRKSESKSKSEQVIQFKKSSFTLNGRSRLCTNLYFSEPHFFCFG